MTSEAASASPQQPEPGGGQAEAAQSPLTHPGLDIASQIKSVARAETDLARMVGDYSATVENTLCVIDIIEETLQQKRKQIAEIQARQEALALEYRQLGRTLDAATKDLAQQFSDIIKDLETDRSLARPIAGASGKAPQESAAAGGAIAETPAETAVAAPADRFPGASEKIASALAETAAHSEAASGLDLETSDLPPVPEFLGDRNDAADQGKEEPRDGGSSSRSWWKQSKKG
jgi:hypothetical protein